MVHDYREQYIRYLSVFQADIGTLVPQLAVFVICFLPLTDCSIVHLKRGVWKGDVCIKDVSHCMVRRTGMTKSVRESSDVHIPVFKCLAANLASSSYLSMTISSYKWMDHSLVFVVHSLLSTLREKYYHITYCT